MTSCPVLIFRCEVFRGQATALCLKYVEILNNEKLKFHVLFRPRNSKSCFDLALRSSAQNSNLDIYFRAGEAWDIISNSCLCNSLENEKLDTSINRIEEVGRMQA